MTMYLTQVPKSKNYVSIWKAHVFAVPQHQAASPPIIPSRSSQLDRQENVAILRRQTQDLHMQFITSTKTHYS